MIRFFKPKKDWKYVEESTKEETIHNSFKLFNWTLSFTKNVVQIAFIIFVFANIFIMSMIVANFIRFGELSSLDTLINEIYNMFIVVIGGYIIKSGVENSIKISFSVISDYLEKRNGITSDTSSEENNQEEDMS